MADIKELKQHDEGFYPLTVGQAVIFPDDNTNANLTESQMDLIFDWSRNYISLTSIDETYPVLIINPQL